MESGEERDHNPGHHMEPTRPSTGDVDNTQLVRKHHVLSKINMSYHLGPPPVHCPVAVSPLLAKQIFEQLAN